MCITFFSQRVLYIRACERLLIPLDRMYSSDSFYSLAFSFFIAGHCNKKFTGVETLNLVTLEQEK